MTGGAGEVHIASNQKQVSFQHMWLTYYLPKREAGWSEKTIFDIKPPRPAGHVLVANRYGLIVQEPAHHSGALAPEHFSL